MYNISFETNNPNAIRITKDKKLICMISCPPCENGCDIINFDDTLNDGYTFNFKGLILISNPLERRIFHKGFLIAQTYR